MSSHTPFVEIDGLGLPSYHSSSLVNQIKI